MWRTARPQAKPCGEMLRGGRPRDVKTVVERPGSAATRSVSHEAPPPYGRRRHGPLRLTLPSRSRMWLAVLLTLAGAPLAAQEPQTWLWTTDGTAFFGYNYQQRKFTDFTSWESQNWFMLMGQRPLAA